MSAANILKSGKAYSRRLLATFLRKSGRFGTAHKYYLKSLKTLPHDIRIHKGLAYAHLGLGQLHDAILRLEIVARISPDDGETQNMLAE